MNALLYHQLAGLLEAGLGVTPASEEIAAYRELLERLDRWFADARARHPGVIPCTGGCTGTSCRIAGS